MEHESVKKWWWVVHTGPTSYVPLCPGLLGTTTVYTCYPGIITLKAPFTVKIVPFG